MMTNRFLQIHFLTSYPSSLLNRDDAGFAKRIPFGGTVRTRVSSQCLKRHWRTFDGEHSLQELGELAVRSRLTFDRFVVQPLVAEGMDHSLVERATELVMAVVLGQSAKAKKKAAEDSDEKSAIETGQITVLGKPELDYLRSVVRELVASSKTEKEIETKFKNKSWVNASRKDWKENLQALGDSGLDAALFGRMVTSDILARRDAAIHVAHAMTVHAEASESDYFSAVDDLVRTDDSLGSGHIGSTELTSGLFYGYVVVDVPLLLGNLAGGDAKQADEKSRDLAARVAQNLVHLVATVSPGAKLGSTAPYAYANWVMVEAGKSQPRTLANAFLTAVRERPSLLDNTYQALADYLGGMDQMYGRTTDRVFAAIGGEKLEPYMERKGSLAEVASWAAQKVREG